MDKATRSPLYQQGRVPKPRWVARCPFLVNGKGHQNHFQLSHMGFKLLFDLACNLYFLQESHKHGQLGPQLGKRWRLISYPAGTEPRGGGWGGRDEENILKTVIKETLPGQNVQANTITRHLLYGLRMVI